MKKVFWKFSLIESNRLGGRGILHRGEFPRVNFTREQIFHGDKRRIFRQYLKNNLKFNIKN